MNPRPMTKSNRMPDRRLMGLIRSAGPDLCYFPRPMPAYRLVVVGSCIMGSGPDFTCKRLGSMTRRVCRRAIGVCWSHACAGMAVFAASLTWYGPEIRACARHRAGKAVGKLGVFLRITFFHRYHPARIEQAAKNPEQRRHEASGADSPLDRTIQTGHLIWRCRDPVGNQDSARL